MSKKILVVTRGDVNSKNGGAFHLRNLIKCLEKHGHVITIIHCPDGGYDMPLCLAELEKMKNMICDVRPDVVLADYSWMASVFDIVPAPVLKMVFVHDLRCRIVPCLVSMGYIDCSHWTEEKETALLKKADILLVLNKDDEAFCNRMAPEAKTVRIGIYMEPVLHNPAKEIPERCIYIGSNNMENRIAINKFGNEVWPKVKESVPNASITCVLGFDENLEQHYAEAQLALVPHGMQGGLKIKTAEAFQHGLPVVGNVCAFDGFEDGPLGGFDDPLEMSEAIIRLLKEDETRKFYRNFVTGINGYQDMMTSQRAYGELLRVLE